MQDDKIELRYYSIPKGEYLVSKLGKGWEQEYAKGMGRQLHFHNVYEIGYCYHGKGEALIDDRSYFYGDNCYTFVPANITHTTISEPGNICKWEWLFIDLEGFIRDAARLDDMSKEEIIRIISRRGTMKSRKNHPVMANIVLNLIRESRAKERLYKASIEAYLSALVIELLRLDEERQYSERAGRVSRYIQSAIDYVHFHYTEEIKVSKMALVCGLSESHFRRIFEESVGMTPMDYINIVRIEKACSLLSGTEQSVKEIYHLKTSCYSVIGPLRLGLLLGGADEASMRAMDRFGDELGIAYQIMDDILGIYSEADYLGKDVGSDISEYKQTILYLYVRSQAPEYYEELSRYYGKRQVSVDELEEVRRIFRESGALDYARSVMDACFARAERKLSRMRFVGREEREILKGFISYCRTRNR